jgi:hypothetical protein
VRKREREREGERGREGEGVEKREEKRERQVARVDPVQNQTLPAQHGHFKVFFRECVRRKERGERGRRM